MSGAWIAFWTMVIAPSVLYLCKRLIDWTFPPGVHLPWLDKYTRPNKEPSEEDTDE